jgi:ParB-like chromosome segregation protein Spo0J
VEVTSDILEQTATSGAAIRRVNLDDIIISNCGRRHTDSEVAVMASSIALLGIQTPPSLDPENKVVAGNLRVLGARRAGLRFIDCFVIEDATDQRLWAIAENLHRSELTPLERSAALVQWVEATKGGQLEQVSGGRGKKGGVADAARALGVDRNVLRRAAAIASISPEACAAVKKAGLDRNQAALLSIAATPVERQLEKINEYSAGSAPTSRAEIRFQALVRAWENADRGARARFIAEIVAPYSAEAQSKITAP